MSSKNKQECRLSCPKSCQSCVARLRGFCTLLDLETLDYVSKRTTHITLPPKTLVHVNRPDTAPKYISIMMSGVAKNLMHLENGKEQILRFLYPNDVWNLTIPVDANSHNEFCTETVTESAICLIPTTIVSEICKKNPKVIRFQEDLIKDELSHLRRQIVILGKKTASERVASFLLEMYKNQASIKTPMKGDKSKIYLPMSRSDVGDYLGLEVETVSRTLTNFKNKEVLTTEGNSTIWASLEKLKDESGSKITKP